MFNIDSIVPSHLGEASEEEIIAFFQALLGLARADGQNDSSEMEFISEAIHELEIENPEQILSPKPISEILDNVRCLQGSPLALELIRKMCMLSHIDSTLSDNETLFIGKIGLAMGLKLEKIEQISNWVIDYIIWIEQARLIFEEDK